MLPVYLVMACELSSKWQLQPLYRPGRGGRGREQKVPCLFGDGFESYSVALQNAATTNKKLPVMACKYICCTTKWWLKGKSIAWSVRVLTFLKVTFPMRRMADSTVNILQNNTH